MHGILVTGNTPNYSKGDFIEYCWSQCYADAKYVKGRTVAELAEHVHEGLNTAREARPGFYNIRGALFA